MTTEPTRQQIPSQILRSRFFGRSTPGRPTLGTTSADEEGCGQQEEDRGGPTLDVDVVIGERLVRGLHAIGVAAVVADLEGFADLGVIVVAGGVGEFAALGRGVADGDVGVAPYAGAPR
jgi:hypothetical protein